MENEIEDLRDIERVYKKYYQSLLNIVYRITKDHDAAEDVVQDMFIKLWNKRTEIKIETSCKAYLFRAASNSAINYLQAEKRKQCNEDLSKVISEKYIDESYKCNGNELEALINQALDKLPPKCRAIFLLSRLEGLKYQEIAARLCISVKTVENQMGIALKKLREELHPYFDQ